MKLGILMGILILAVFVFAFTRGQGFGETVKSVGFIAILAAIAFVGSVFVDYLEILWSFLSDITGLKEKTIIMLSKALGIAAVWAVIIWFWIKDK